MEEKKRMGNSPGARREWKGGPRARGKARDPDQRWMVAGVTVHQRCELALPDEVQGRGRSRRSRRSRKSRRRRRETMLPYGSRRKVSNGGEGMAAETAAKAERESELEVR